MTVKNFPFDLLTALQRHKSATVLFLNINLRITIRQAWF